MSDIKRMIHDVDSYVLLPAVCDLNVQAEVQVLKISLKCK